ncbi:MAG TPA: hypothetical protein PK765_05770 [bacterium]|nr:hypothetical protein [bacterium]
MQIAINRDPPCSFFEKCEIVFPVSHNQAGLRGDTGLMQVLFELFEFLCGLIRIIGKIDQIPVRSEDEFRIRIPMGHAESPSHRFNVVIHRTGYEADPVTIS